MNSYELSRMFWDWSFENPDKIKPNHSALYFFIIEHCNRLGWKNKFGLPTTMAKEAIGIRSYNTYINTLNDLVEFGFITLIEKSKNQYSSNIVALSNNNKALDKALDKALIKHGLKQSESTSQSIDSIDKQLNKEPINKETIESFDFDYKIELTNYIKHLQESYDRSIGHMQIEQMIKMLNSWYQTRDEKINCISMNISSGWKTLNFVEPNNSEKKIDYTQDVLSK